MACLWWPRQMHGCGTQMRPYCGQHCLLHCGQHCIFIEYDDILTRNVTTSLPQQNKMFVMGCAPTHLFPGRFSMEASLPLWASRSIHACFSFAVWAVYITRDLRVHTWYMKIEHRRCADLPHYKIFLCNILNTTSAACKKKQSERLPIFDRRLIVGVRLFRSLWSARKNVIFSIELTDSCDIVKDKNTRLHRTVAWPGQGWDL